MKSYPSGCNSDLRNFPISHMVKKKYWKFSVTCSVGYSGISFMASICERRRSCLETCKDWRKIELETAHEKEGTIKNVCAKIRFSSE